ncbi:ATP-binding cassette domain-containing protein [Clostridium estertheticum]|uniref:ATP-binding cassette domain-containing protein n=1 Tax=Clostridium estertheticum TaxID=238834 RepID=UPI001C7D4A9D|nr:ATP-binding cassette domain-containing protein [Clostridium estertheticum]MBX4267209.1 ATP-binding cassette domain-containing protein [Clostridium estertheticum]WLC91206.1 ATP-binding cassette domain-containing protein [Clostridium estertheticum]
MNYVLKTDNLTKKFKNQIAVNGINIRIKKGDIYGLVGKNGAGKTTLMKMIVGLSAPTSGELELFEKNELCSGRKKIGCVIEMPALYPNMTAEQNLSVQATLIGNNAQNSIAKILELVGLQEVGKKKVVHFSLGMKQRLGIGIALIGNPEFLILDEPVNGLDPIGVKEVRNLLLKLNTENGITILISSHILSELYKIANVFGIINDGSLVSEIQKKDLDNEVSSSDDIEDYFIRLLGDDKNE